MLFLVCLVCTGLIGVLPDDPVTEQGIAVTGSPCDSFSVEPWVVRLRQLLAAAVRRGQRVLGMCFGCQVVAVSLQGSAGKRLPLASSTFLWNGHKVLPAYPRHML